MPVTAVELADSVVPAHSPARVASNGVNAQPSAQTGKSTARQPQLKHLAASCVQPFVSPAPAGKALQKQQAKSGRLSSTTSRAAMTPAAGLGVGLSSGKQVCTGPAMQTSPAPSEAAAAAEVAITAANTDADGGVSGRESLGGTQGAITGLTHLALQKHNAALPAASAIDPGTSGLTNDSQGLGMQARPCIMAEGLTANCATAHVRRPCVL